MAAPIRALIFDMDGTLVDTESQTDLAIEAVLARHGITRFSLPPVETRGRTWMHVAERIRDLTGLDVPAPALSAALLEEWNRATAEVRPLPGAPDALRAAAAHRLRLAVVSSSPRAVIERLLGSIGVLELFDVAARIGGDDVRRGKPDPEGFLEAARRLAAGPEAALVFEDSRAGLLAARAAGMRSVFVTCCATDVGENAPLASAAIGDYRDLPPAFWTDPSGHLLALRQPAAT
ncbi:MAG: HAD family phosphatase [Proteobacteria bacterium]|nr:HAD family phosphatase [Pseudomonadota bacterium]